MYTGDAASNHDRALALQRFKAAHPTQGFEYGQCKFRIKPNYTGHKADAVMDMLKSGMTPREIMDISGFAGCFNMIPKMLHYAPKRQEKTNVVFVTGPTGCGKTLTTSTVLEEHFGKNGMEYHVFQKDNGWAKFWCGYGMEDCVVIDDPGRLFQPFNKGEYEQYLNILGSSGKCFVEIKGSQAPFRGKLVIILSNMTSTEILTEIPTYHMEAFERRFNQHTFTWKAPDCKHRYEC